MQNLAAYLQRSATLYPDQTAIVFGDTRLSYAQLNAAANQVASGLISRGLKPGERVALGSPNLPYFPIAYYGILKAGGVVVPLNILLRPKEIEYHLQDCGARFYLCFEGSAELPLATLAKEAFEQVDTCEELFIMAAADKTALEIDGQPTLAALMKDQPTEFDYLPRSNDDLALLIYTSGTTGLPKGAMLTHTNIAQNSMVGITMMKYEKNDTLLLTLPLFHVFGQVLQLQSGIAAGATLVMIPRFDPEQVLTLMDKENVTQFAGVPTMYIALLNVKDLKERFDLEKISQKMRVCVSGGAAIPVEVIRQFEETFKAPILEGYGLSETSPIVCFNSLDSRVPGSVGKPVIGVDIRIIDENGESKAQGEEGEILVRGHNVMSGYFNSPEKTADAIKDSWFYTGDIGRLDEDCNLFIVDRVKDVIIRGGFNVYPRELEEVLMTHSQVANVAVVGVPHEKLGEEVMACIVPANKDEASLEVMHEWVKDRFASHKYPRLIEFYEELPMTATGKILKRELRDQLKKT